MKIIIISNIKGGVGKTTTAHLLIEGLRRRGFKTLGIDLDPQCNLSYNYDFKEGFTSYELLKGVSIHEVIQNDFIPGSVFLSELQNELSKKMGKEFVLKKALVDLHEEYDYVVIDTAPASDIVNINAYVCADYAIIPTQADAYNLKSIDDCFEFVEGVNEYYQGHVKIAGLLLTRFADKGTYNTTMKEIIEEKIGSKNVKIFTTTIRENKTISEAVAVKEVLFDYKPSSNGAIDYNNFIDELLIDIEPAYNKSGLDLLMNQLIDRSIALSEAYNKLEKYSLEQMIKEFERIYKNSNNITAQNLLQIYPSESHLKVILFFVIQLKREFTNMKYLTKVIKDKTSSGEEANIIFEKLFSKEKK